MVGRLVGFEPVSFKNKTNGELVEFNRYHVLVGIDPKYGIGERVTEVTSKKNFNVPVGKAVKVSFDSGYGGKAICSDIALV